MPFKHPTDQFDFTKWARLRIEVSIPAASKTLVNFWWSNHVEKRSRVLDLTKNGVFWQKQKRAWWFSVRDLKAYL